MNAPRVVHVAVAVIRDEGGRVLVAQRLPHQHLAGLWEFPGGKVEPGETLAQGMYREIREELGIEVETLAPLLRIEHTYPEKTVLLDVWRVLLWSGKAPAATGAEGQPLRWVHPDEMIAAEFPPADVPIIAALQLPPHYAISPDLLSRADAGNFVGALMQPGRDVRMVQVRLKQQPALAPELITAIRQQLPSAKILLNSDTQAALASSSGEARTYSPDELHGADGLHLTTAALLACVEKPAAFCAASCHDAEEIAKAFSLGLGFVTLSPVLATRSHPDAPALGWEIFSALSANAGLPVYALGGMRMDMTDEAVSKGAVGIAGISLILG